MLIQCQRKLWTVQFNYSATSNWGHLFENNFNTNIRLQNTSPTLLNRLHFAISLNMCKVYPLGSFCSDSKHYKWHICAYKIHFLYIKWKWICQFRHNLLTVISIWHSKLQLTDIELRATILNLQQMIVMMMMTTIIMISEQETFIYAKN